MASSQFGVASNVARFSGRWKIRGEKVARAHRHDAQRVSVMVVWSVARCGPGQRAGSGAGFLEAPRVHRNRSRSGFTFPCTRLACSHRHAVRTSSTEPLLLVAGEAFDELVFGAWNTVVGLERPTTGWGLGGADAHELSPEVSGREALFF